MTYPYTTGYSGRQTDIELLQSVARPVVLQQVTVSNVADTPKIVAGVQKLAQRYTLLLLTDVSSVQFDEDQGTSLLARILGGTIQNRGRLQGAFAVASSRVLDQLRKDDRQEDVFGDAPDDEVLNSTQLIDFDIDFDANTVYLKVKLTTDAGTDITFVVPATTTG